MAILFASDFYLTDTSNILRTMDQKNLYSVCELAPCSFMLVQDTRH